MQNTQDKYAIIYDEHRPEAKSLFQEIVKKYNPLSPAVLTGMDVLKLD